MQKHVNCGAFGSVDKITCHIKTFLKLCKKVRITVLDKREILFFFYFSKI